MILLIYEVRRSFLRQKQIEEKWHLLLDRMEKRKQFLVTLSEVNPIISDIEKVSSHLKEVEVCDVLVLSVSYEMY